MKTTIQPPEVYVKDTGTEKGRGAFAIRDFKEGELVEECPVIILLRPIDLLPPRLKTMVFNWGALTKSSASSALSLGFGSMYNHANPACLRYEANPENQSMRYIAVRDIKKNEELTINYNEGGGSHVSEKDTWFEGRGIKLIKD